jgi:predicted small secreted protein
MKRVRLVLSMLVGSLCLAGCYSHTNYVGVNPLNILSGKYAEDIVVKETASVWLTAIESPGYSEAFITEKCPSQHGSIKKSRGFVQSLVLMCTLGIYHSIEVEIGCEKAPATAMRLTPNQVKRLVASANFLPVVAEQYPDLLAGAAEAHALALADSPPAY